MKKRMLCALLALILTLGSLPTAVFAAAPSEEAPAPLGVGGFSDVQEGDYFADAVLWAVEEEVTKGTSKTTFSPEATCTVGQILTFLYRMNGSPKVVSPEDQDLPSAKHDYVLWAAEKGLIEAEGFEPTAPCTRLQVITFFWKLAGSPELPEVEAASEPGWELLLVNPWHYIPEDYTFTLQDVEGGHQTDARIAGALAQMLADCRKAGYYPVVSSSYRTQAVQEGLFYGRIDARVAAGMSREEATRVTAMSTAVPGTSEHQLGLALDIVDSSNYVLNASQAQTPAQQWLMAHCWEYGFILRYPADKTTVTGIIYEPWHYRYVGKKAAKAIHFQGICLEEYLDGWGKYDALIAWATAEGITRNDSYDAFLPAQTCTRGQIITFLYRRYAKSSLV